VAERLATPTTLGETTALHVRLPPPLGNLAGDPEPQPLDPEPQPNLSASLVRIVGPIDSPQVLFRSDALAQLGVIAKSPGPDFFTAFATLSLQELDKLKQNQDQIASGKFGPTTTESVLFAGRSAIGRTINPNFDPSAFTPGGGSVAVRSCPIRPVSTAAAWGKSLFITDPAVVQNSARTWDPCTGAGTKGGVWTFAHFIKEMASGSGKTSPDFVKDWLSLWLNDYVVNEDTILARPAMFSQVIAPWAAASGVTATLVTDASGYRSVTLTGPLDLDIAPFRLVAIVNRIDLRAMESGPSGYSGSVTSLPTTPGELRFIFSVVQPNPWGAGSEASCGKKLFTTIFEYGVPGTDCTAVRSWAQKWTSLQALPGFTSTYLAQLESMTESVVVHGAAPAKGNQNAINQIRTNERALHNIWELREFTLTDERPASNTNVPANGGLRTHTVAQTPNDSVFDAAGADPAINGFVNGPVTRGVERPASNPAHCEAAYTVPYFVGSTPFRGGNALIGPGRWLANSVTATSPTANTCARHQFSLNTCGGCHQDDTCTDGLSGSTSFTHIDPLSPIPVTLSKFLTGGGPGMTFDVADTQPGTGVVWPFADLQRRLELLWDLSECTACIAFHPMTPPAVVWFEQRGGAPIDPSSDFRGTGIKIGPVTDPNILLEFLDVRKQFAGATITDVADNIRSVQRVAH